RRCCVVSGGAVGVWAGGRLGLERRYLPVPGAQTVAGRSASPPPLPLRLEPLLAFRDYHALGHRNEAASPAFEQRDEPGQRRVGFRPYASLPALWVTHRGTSFVSAPVWHENVEYLEELERGLDFREDLLL